MYKLLTLPMLVLAMVGCGSNFKTIPTDPVCTEYPWFLDADADGWGDPNSTGIMSCNPDDATGFTVTNNRDCDDADASVTGRAGSLCPADVPIGNGSIVQFSISTTEYLLANVPANNAIDGSSVVWPEYARDVCSAEGWGGTYVITDEDGTIHEDEIDLSRTPAGLLVVNDIGEFGVIKDHVASDYWATWINATVDTTSGEWTWDSPFSFSELGGFCDNVSAPSDDPALQQLALIKRKLAGDTASKYCLGNPDQVWGRYFKDVATGVDTDGDGLNRDVDPDDEDPDVDDDGIKDGQEADVIGTDPETADDVPVLPNVDNPIPAFQTELAYFVCEREAPNPERFAMHDLPPIQ